MIVSQPKKSNEALKGIEILKNLNIHLTSQIKYIKKTKIIINIFSTFF